jgi:hypothetical protein
MKKYILSLLFAISVATVSAQSFNGVPISGDIGTVIAKFKAKGFTLNKYVENGAIMKGSVSGESLELFIFTTPKSKKVCKLVMYLDEDISWYSLKSNYFRYVQILTNKYGSPDNHDEYFIKPYYEGDGYELQAVELEKTYFMSYWLRKDNLTLAVEISKYKQVKLTYENDMAMEIRKKEQDEIDANSF